MPQLTYSREEVRAILHQAYSDCAQRSQVLRVLQDEHELQILTVNQSSDGIVVRVGAVRPVSRV